MRATEFRDLVKWFIDEKIVNKKMKLLRKIKKYYDPNNEQHNLIMNLAAIIISEV